MRRRCFALAVILVCGCYEFLPAPRPDTLVGRRVQVTVTDEGSAVLASQIGPSGEAVGGTLMADADDAYVISTTTVRYRSGWETGWRGEEVRVPRRVVVKLEERQLSKTRTTLASVVAAAALVMAKNAFGGLGGSNAPGGSPTGPSGGR